MDKSIPPLMCNTPPPMDDGFEDDEEEVSVESNEVSDSSAPSTPSKLKSLDNDLPVPVDLPTVPHIFPITPEPVNTIHPPDDIFIKQHADPVYRSIITSIENQPSPTLELPTPPPSNHESDRRSESPPSLELHDPPATDGSFDDPNLDDIPEDDFYTNTDMSLPSLRLDLVVDRPSEDVHLSSMVADASPDQRTDEDLSTASKDLTEDDLILPPIDTPNFEKSTYGSPSPDVNSSPISIGSYDVMPDKLPPPLDDVDEFNDSFNDFNEFIDVSIKAANCITNEVIAQIDSSEKDTTLTVPPLMDSIEPNIETLNEFDESKTNASDIDVIDEVQTISCDTDDVPAFDVDFSQFNAFESVPPSSVFVPEHVENNAEEDDDDFGDFNDAPQTFATHFPPMEAVLIAAESEDDDFGDFSAHFQGNQPVVRPTLQTNVENVCSKVDSLLAMMFPVICLGSQVSEADETTGKRSSSTVGANEELLSDITLAVRNVDDSKALQHQWLTSTTKSSLVKALGIDSRIILHGGKWNSSMPRFAANLGCTPLEPTKSAESLASSRTTTEVPAAQFDWNTSGLVNPLDDQLVVVSPNLDKLLTIASSAAYSDSVVGHRSRRSSSASSSTSSSLTANCTPHHTLHPKSSSPINPTFPSHLSPIIATTSSTTTPYIHHVTNTSCGGSAAPLLDDHTRRRGLFDHFLDSRVQEILHEANAAQNRPPRSDAHWPLRSSTQQRPEAAHIPSGPAAAAQPTSFQLSPPSVADHPTAVSPAAIDDDDIPAPVSASYAVPGSSGTLKETHIFTPIKMSAPVVEDRAEKCAPESAVRIDENVIKKEYHDIEYNPQPSTPSVADEFSDYHSVNETPQILQPIQSSIFINWPDPGRLTGIELGSFDEFISNDSSHLNNNVTNNVELQQDLKEDNSSSSFEVAEHNPSFVETKDEYIRITPTPSPKPSIDFDFFTSHVEPDVNPKAKLSVVNHFLDATSNHFGQPCTSTSDITSDQFPTLTNGLSKSPIATQQSDSFDDFCDFQCVPIPLPEAPTAISHPQMPRPLEPTHLLTPTNTPSTAEPASQIAWPDPGIDTDEMARLEAIFPTPKTISLPNPITAKSGSPKRQGATTDEVEWTDFVSSSGGFQPITHIINQNILKHQQEKPDTVADEDDWSDFVSGQSNNHFSPLKMAIATGPNFSAWNSNATPSFGSWTPTTSSFKPPSQQPDTSAITQISNRLPTVSLIPDLGFVAPAPPSFVRGASIGSSARKAHQSSYGAPARK